MNKPIKLTAGGINFTTNILTSDKKSFIRTWTKGGQNRSAKWIEATWNILQSEVIPAYKSKLEAERKARQEASEKEQKAKVAKKEALSLKAKKDAEMLEEFLNDDSKPKKAKTK